MSKPETTEEPEVVFMRDIDAWVQREIEAGAEVPDFWDEFETTERLAAYLSSLGYQKR